MKQLQKTSNFCLSSAIDHARSFSIEETLEVYPELQQHERLLSNLLEVMAAADRAEAAMTEQNKAVDQLSKKLKELAT